MFCCETVPVWLSLGIKTTTPDMNPHVLGEGLVYDPSLYPTTCSTLTSTPPSSFSLFLLVEQLL